MLISTATFEKGMFIRLKSSFHQILYTKLFEVIDSSLVMRHIQEKLFNFIEALHFDNLSRILNV